MGHGNDIGAALGATLREQAIDRTERANQGWIRLALQVVRDLAHSNAEFTTDKVWHYLKDDEPPTEPRAMGAVMRKAVAEGLVSNTNRTVCSVRPGCHRRPIRVWKSLLFVP